MIGAEKPVQYKWVLTITSFSTNGIDCIWIEMKDQPIYEIISDFKLLLIIRPKMYNYNKVNQKSKKV
jgi:hypothetical protein